MKKFLFFSTSAALLMAFVIGASLRSAHMPQGPTTVEVAAATTVEHVASLTPGINFHEVNFVIQQVPNANPIEEEEPEEEVRRPMVALTFDDGPSQFTDPILDLLYEHGGRATFFVLGYRIGSRPETIIRMNNLGNEVANHSWGHAHLVRLDANGILWELNSAREAIEAVIGQSAPLLRPPFGSTNATVRQVAADLGYPIINWNLDTMDWRYRDPERIYNVIMDNVEDGSVILLHDIHGTTATAMERVIPRLVEEGFDLVTVSELLNYFYGELEPGKIYGMSFDR